MSTSYWLYIHPELQGKEHYWKVGKSLTPYSAVRSRQRFLVNDFYLTNLWFGDPNDIATVENIVHSMYRPNYNSKLGSGRGELVYYNELEHGYPLDIAISTVIRIRNANVKPMSIGNPLGYHATNSTQCAFNCPQEKDAHTWSRRKLKEMFGLKVNDPRSMFDELFDRSTANNETPL